MKGKSYLLKRFVKKPSKASKSRTHKYERKKSVTIDREVKKLACFNQKTSAAVRKVEKAAANHANNYPLKASLHFQNLEIPP